MKHKKEQDILYILIMALKEVNTILGQLNTTHPGVPGEIAHVAKRLQHAEMLYNKSLKSFENYEQTQVPNILKQIEK